jgi:hypothetical protein
VGAPLKPRNPQMMILGFLAVGLMVAAVLVLGAFSDE